MVSDYQIDSGGAKWCFFLDLCCPEPYMARSWHRTHGSRHVLPMEPDIHASHSWWKAVSLHWNALKPWLSNSVVDVSHSWCSSHCGEFHDISCAHQHLKAKCIQRIQIIEMDKTVSWPILLSCKPTFSSTHSKRATPKLWTILDLQGQSQILCILVETWDWQYVSNPTYRKRNRSCRRHQLVLLSAVQTCWNHILNMFEPESSWNSLHAWRRILTPWWLYSQNVSLGYPQKKSNQESVAIFFAGFFSDPSRPIHLAKFTAAPRNDNWEPPAVVALIRPNQWPDPQKPDGIHDGIHGIHQGSENPMDN